MRSEEILKDIPPSFPKLSAVPYRQPIRVQEYISDDPPLHDPSMIMKAFDDDAEKTKEALAFVSHNVNTFLLLIRTGFIRLLGESGEPAIAFIHCQSLRDKL